MRSDVKKPWGVLFDVDGVILDSFTAFQSVWKDWANRHALEYANVWAATHGRRPVDTVAEVAPHLNPEREYAWLQSRAKHPDLEFPAFAGAAEFLRAIPPDGWALVTSSHEPAVRSRFEKAGLPDPLHVVDATKVAVGKPEPHCYLLGASLLDVTPERCIVFEDSPAGVTSGKNAGCYVVAIASTHTEQELEDAHLVVRDLVEARDVFQQWSSR